MNNQNSQPTESGIDLKAVYHLVLRYWYLFAISLLLAVLAAKIFLRYSQPVYGVRSSLLIKDDKRKVGTEDFLQGLELLSVSKNIQNEIQVISSYKNVRRAMEELNFDVSYFIKGNIKKGELYNFSPFVVKLDTNFIHSKDVPIYIKLLTDSTFSIYHEIESINGEDDEKVISDREECKFGIPCVSEHFSFIVKKAADFETSYSKNGTYYFVIHDVDRLTHQYISKLKIDLINKNSSILNLSTEGYVPQKEIDFLNKLSEVFIQSGLEEKNQITINTIRFIDTQLSEIVDSLKGVENRLENFRRDEKMMNLGSSSEKAFDQLEILERERAELTVKARYYDYLLDYLNYNYDINKLMAPSTIGIEDVLLNKLIEELHTLYSEKTSLDFSTKGKNPTYTIIELKIENTKNSLIENVKNIIQASKMALEDNQQRLNKLQGLLSKLPANERKMVGIQRKFSLNDNIYNYLMEKRMEAGIAKAANTPDNKVINQALLGAVKQVSPDVEKVFLLCILLGLIIPSAFVFFKTYFNDTVTSKELIETKTDVPVIGVIAHSKDAGTIPIINSPKSGVSESIRSLRVNLQYLAAEKKNKVIGVTSSVSGEGKTFFSSNLAASIALSGAKVVLIGADLRKPKLHQIFDIDNSIGLSTYFINKTSAQGAIRKTMIPNLDIIASGPVPPNPTELLESVKTEQLINYLLSEYEYIIIDAPPVGIVSDYYLLARFIDANLYLIRQNYSKIVFLKEIQDIYKGKKLNNLFAVFNDVKSGLGYGYRYYYGDNRYGYYQEEVKRSGMEKLRNFFKKEEQLES